MDVYKWISVITAAALIITFLSNKDLPNWVFNMWFIFVVATAIYGFYLRGSRTTNEEPSLVTDKPKNKKVKEREISPRTPEELAEMADDSERTSIEVETLIEQQIGTWITVKGKLREAQNVGNHSILVWVERASDSFFTVSLFFDIKWFSRIQMLSKGDEIVVTGKVREIGRYQVSLEECELK